MKLRALMICVIVLVAQYACAQDDYKTQTLFIYNFMKYTSWPQQGKEFMIQIYGDSPIVAELEALAQAKKTINGVPITVVQIGKMAELKESNILYVSQDKSKEMEQVAAATKGKPCLIISPKDGMIRKGAVLNFFVKDDDRLGFEVSRARLSERNIKFSGEIMRLAELAD